jgi:hypothetical protein
MMGREIVHEILVIFKQPTRLLAREYFIDFSHRESFRSYIGIVFKAGHGPFLPRLLGFIIFPLKNSIKLAQLMKRHPALRPSHSTLT